MITPALIRNGRALILVLVISLAPALSIASTAEKAKIVTGNENPAECLSSVHVNSIDGKQVYVQPLGFDLEPGTHTLTARTTVNTSFCKVIGNSNVKDKVPPLEAEFAAGKTYYLGYDHSSSNRKDWRLVIWKVEE